MGPQSGGSRLYLSGRNLNIGSSVAVFLDELPCLVERALASSGQLVCRTTAAPYPSYVVSRLLLTIDGANLSLANPYLYTADPTITRVEPLQSFFSGGRSLVVTGTGFTSVQQPRMVVMTRKGGGGGNGQGGQGGGSSSSAVGGGGGGSKKLFHSSSSMRSSLESWSTPHTGNSRASLNFISTTMMAPTTEATVAVFSQRLINDSVSVGFGKEKKLSN